MIFMDGKHLKPIKKQQSSSWKKYIQIKPQVLFSHGIITNPQPIQYIKPLKNIEKISWKIIHTEHKTPWGSYPLKIKKNYQWIQSIEFVMEDKSMVLDNKEKIDEWNYWQGFLWIPESNSLELAKLFFDNE
jgi:hypothetical protein